MSKEIVYIEFLSKNKNFQRDVIEFKGEDAIEEAKKWGIANLENFARDMVKTRN